MERMSERVAPEIHAKAQEAHGFWDDDREEPNWWMRKRRAWLKAKHQLGRELEVPAEVCAKQGHITVAESNACARCSQLLFCSNEDMARRLGVEYRAPINRPWATGPWV